MISIKRLESTDIQEVQQIIALFQEVFELEKKALPETEYLKSLLRKPDFIAMVAIENNDVIGALTGYELPLIHGKKELFVYDLAVHPDHQRKGLGKKLMEGIQEFCTQNNISELFLDANLEDTLAIDFYKAIGGQSSEVIQFSFEMKNSF